MTTRHMALQKKICRRVKKKLQRQLRHEYAKVGTTVVLHSLFSPLFPQNHPWLKDVETDNVDIAEWVAQISKLPMPQ